MTVTTAFPGDRVARGVAIQTIYQNLGAAGTRYRPARVALIGLGQDDVTYSTTKRQVFSAREVGETYGYVSELYTAALALLPPNGDGLASVPLTVYPLAQPSVGPVQATGSITPTGTAAKAETYVVKINNVLSLDVVTAIADTVALLCDKMVEAINAVLGMPCIASDGTTKVDLTAGWNGATGNDIYIEVISPADPDFTFAIVQPTGGAGTITLTSALAQMGSVWETHIVNCAGPVDAVLDQIEAHGIGRSLPTVFKPYTAYSGINTDSVVTCAAVTEARKATDFVNVVVPNPGSHDMPWVIAARAVARIAKLGNENPAHDYGRQQLTGLTPGADSVQWTSEQRDYAVKKGLSTVEVRDGVVCLSDVVTCYHPTGEEPPSYRYVCDLQKLGTIIYNLDLIFGSQEWAGAPLVPDNQAVKNPTAKKPKMAKAALSSLFGTLADDAIIADPDFARDNSEVGIGTINPKRLDVKVVVKLSGNTNVISLDLYFGFNYGV